MHYGWVMNAEDITLAPKPAADDVYTQTSGIDAIDYLKESRSGILPHDLGDWDKVPD